MLPEEIEFCQLADAAYEQHTHGQCLKACGFCEELRSGTREQQQELRRIEKLKANRRAVTQQQAVAKVRPNRDQQRGLTALVQRH